jgi:hypothetical protein
VSIGVSPPPPGGPEWKPWGERLNDYLRRVRSQLAYFETGDSAKDDGIILWDSTGYPVVSAGGEFRQIVLADGHGDFSLSSDFTYPASNTGYAITYAAGSGNQGLTQSGSQIIFEESGYFLITFTAQIYSSAASTTNFVFWPKVNGVNVANGSTIRAALHQNASTTVVSRSAIFYLTANDYLEAFTATDNHTQGSLKGFAASSIATESLCPSTTLTIIRVQR